jgi:hypothetical protein
MIEMIDVGGVVILIAQELQCRNLNQQLKAQEKINADLTLKNQLYIKQIEFLEKNPPISNEKSKQKDTRKNPYSSPSYDYELDNFELNNRSRNGKRYNYY